MPSQAFEKLIDKLSASVPHDKLRPLAIALRVKRNDVEAAIHDQIGKEYIYILFIPRISFESIR